MKNLVLITRPEHSAAHTAEAVHQLGYQTFCEAFLDVVYYDVPIPSLDDFAALVFTSANAVEAFILKNDRRDTPAYCVGAQTLAAVKEAGFYDYQSAQGKVTDLITMLSHAPIDGKILYCRARDVAYPLLVEGKNIEEIILYHTEKSKEMSKKCLDLIQKDAFSYILFYSLRSAETFVELVEKYGVQTGLNQCEALCLGDSMIKCLEYLEWKHIAVAPTPDRQGMLHLLEKNNE